MGGLLYEGFVGFACRLRGGLQYRLQGGLQRRRGGLQGVCKPLLPSLAAWLLRAGDVAAVAGATQLSCYVATAVDANRVPL
jgi:hypothetical protein